MPAFHVCRGVIKRLDKNGNVISQKVAPRGPVLLQDGEKCRYCGSVISGGTPGKLHACDGKPGTSKDVSTCEKCEQPAETARG